MFRLLIIVALLTAVANPTAREYIRPYLSPVLDPAYEWSVRSRVSEIARWIEAERAAGHALPQEGSIETFLEHEYRDGTSGLDPWGEPFHLVRTVPGLRVVSAGRDRILHTRDDVLSPPLSGTAR